MQTYDWVHHTMFEGRGELCAVLCHSLNVCKLCYGCKHHPLEALLNVKGRLKVIAMAVWTGGCSAMIPQ